MNITREDMPGRQVALTIELDEDIVSSALDKAYHQMVNQVNIPGFRRGKAPRYMLERYVGTDTLTERAVKNILPQTVQDAIAEQNIEALDVGDVEIVSMAPLQVKVVIVQPPVVELGDYGSIRAEREAVEITPEQVEEVLTNLRRENAPWNKPAEPRPIEEGDMVYLDLEGFTTEGPLEEASRENFPTIVGLSRAGVPDVVNEALTGMSVGEEKDIAGTLPDDYPTQELAGKDVTYHVIVHSMKSQELTPLDEEFAKKLGYDTVDELRESLAKNLQTRADEAAESKQVNSAIEQIIAGSNVEVPEMMVDEELDGMLKTMENRLKEQRLTLRQYFTYGGITEADWREANREHAREHVISNLVLRDFSRRENISVEDSQIEEKIQEMLTPVQEEEREKARELLAGEEFRTAFADQIFERNLFDRLIGIAEGRIQPAPADESAGTSDQTTEEAPGTALDLENVGGAAELLGTQDVDLRSPNETGEAEGGGTPAEAPGLTS